MVGEQVGSYRIEALLGQGGMGAVYRARHLALGRPAAIKILLPQFASAPDIVRRFFNEARAATSIRHLGIVEIYDFGAMADGTAYIAMELLRGQSLADRLEHQQVEPLKALAFLRQMCGALGAAHEIGIVHRDLKPDNVFIVPDPEVAGGERIKLLDFGIAKLTEESSALHSHTRTGALMGTPTYMSPEQCRGVKVDLRSDIYSLGCILYELIARRPPFRGEGVGDVLGAHMYDQAVPLTTVVSGCAVGISQLADTMMAKDPAHRPQSAAAVIALIDLVLASPTSAFAGTTSRADAAQVGRGHELSTLSGGAGATGPATAQRGTPRWPLVAASVVTFAAVAGGVYLAFGRPADRADAQLDAGAAGGGADSRVAVAPTGPDAGIDVVARRAIRLKIMTKPEGADVFVEGRRRGTTPFDATWTPTADHIEIVLRKDGFVEQSIEASADQDVDQVVTLAAAATGRARDAAGRTSRVTRDARPTPANDTNPDAEAETVNPLKPPR